MENYIVSARKYRPQTFETVVGQQALTQTLQNAINAGAVITNVSALSGEPGGWEFTLSDAFFISCSAAYAPVGDHERIIKSEVLGKHPAACRAFPSSSH